LPNRKKSLNLILRSFSQS